jgi:hypothetical protein
MTTKTRSGDYLRQWLPDELNESLKVEPLFGVARADVATPRLSGAFQPPRPLTRLERLEARVRRLRGRVGWSLRLLGAWIDGEPP